MNKRKKSDPIDDVNPEWSTAEVAKATRASALPASLRTKLGLRGPQKAPLKRSTTIRFDAEVLEALKATGRGWQTRVNDAMREWIKTHSTPRS